MATQENRRSGANFVCPATRKDTSKINLFWLNHLWRPSHHVEVICGTCIVKEQVNLISLPMTVQVHCCIDSLWWMKQYDQCFMFQVEQVSAFYISHGSKWWVQQWKLHKISMFCLWVINMNVLASRWSIKVVFELPSGGNIPVRAHGSRWITHKRNTLLCVIDRYHTYISHLTALSQDIFVKPDDRAWLKGYLKRWMEYRVVFGCSDILKPAQSFTSG